MLSSSDKAFKKKAFIQSSSKQRQQKTDTITFSVHFGRIDTLKQIFLYLTGVDAWWTNFKGYIAEEKNVSDWRSTIENKTEDAEDEQRNFPWLLSEFLHSRQGSKYKRNFHFDGNLTCNFPAPPITVCTRVSNNLTFTFFYQLWLKALNWLFTISFNHIKLSFFASHMKGSFTLCMFIRESFQYLKLILVGMGRF